MQYRKFGSTDWQISEIGFGAWQLGGDWAAADDANSIRTLLHAFERGINFVDTAQMYGNGHSETVVGQALKQWDGARIYVATKVQPISWPSPNEDMPMMQGRYPDGYLRKAVEDSLTRLQLERLDLLQLHCWIPDGLKELGWFETLNDLRHEGKLDKVGVSLRDYKPEEGVALAKSGLVSSQQVVFNLFEQRPAGDLFHAATDAASAFIARVPFDSGSLIGNWTEQTYKHWPTGSVPHSLFRGERFAKTLARVEALKQDCAPYYATLAEAAIRYILHSKQVSTVIPGMSNPREVDMNIAYSDGQEFSLELLEKLKSHCWSRNYYQ